MIRVGIVGCGFIGTVHSYALRKLAAAGLIDAGVVATFDPDAERAAGIAAHHRAEVCRDLDALLDAVDVAWVCTWTAAHHEAIEAAAARGRAVFCEKPLAPTLAECEQIAARLAGIPHQVGLVLRHAPVFRALAAAVASGRYGRPMAAILRDDQYFPVQGVYASDWRSDVARAGGGTLLEHSIHDVDLMRWVFGTPTEVGARTASLLGHAGIDDTTVLTLVNADGSTATIVSVWHQILTRARRDGSRSSARTGSSGPTTTISVRCESRRRRARRSSNRPLRHGLPTSMCPMESPSRWASTPHRASSSSTRSRHAATRRGVIRRRSRPLPRTGSSTSHTDRPRGAVPRCRSRSLVSGPARE